MSSVVLIGTRSVGPGYPCFVIAEAGVNHNGDIATAHRLIDAAAAARADAVKFQAFEPEAIASKTTAAAEYQKATTGAKTQLELLRGLALPETAWRELADHAADAGLIFLCTPFDLRSAGALDALGIVAFKVPSGELDNLGFIRDLATRGRPLLISTGMATIDEVAVALDAARHAPGVCLFHCVTSYPAPPGASNLRAIVALSDRFALPVGWSDHTTGPTTAIGAVALGATLLEKHLTLDRAADGPDHSASADPDQFAEYVRAVRDVEAALGDGIKRPQEIELENRDLVRRSWHAARDLEPGVRIAPDDVVLLRPATGLAPAASPYGAEIVRRVAQGEPLTADDIRQS